MGRRTSAALSQWELDEMAALARAGWRSESLAALYGVTRRTIDRILRRIGGTDGSVPHEHERPHGAA